MKNLLLCILLGTALSAGCDYTPERPSVKEPVVSGPGRFGLLAELDRKRLYLYQNKELGIQCVIYAAHGQGGISCIPDQQEVR